MRIFSARCRCFLPNTSWLATLSINAPTTLQFPSTELDITQKHFGSANTPPIYSPTYADCECLAQHERADFTCATFRILISVLAQRQPFRRNSDNPTAFSKQKATPPRCLLTLPSVAAPPRRSPGEEEGDDPAGH